MGSSRFRVRQRIKFFLERQFVKGAGFQLLVIAALIGLISLIGGILVVYEGEPTSTIGESVWWAFLRLTDPGYLGDDEGLWRRFVSTILTVLGYVVFLGSLVAIITTWLNRKTRNLEQGLTPVSTKNHVIILGWTNRTIHTAGEILQSSGRLSRFLKFHRTRKLEIVILSEDVTPEHYQALSDNPLIGGRAGEIVLRSGQAIDREDLRRVDSSNAAAIIIPTSSYIDKEYITPDVETIKTLLSLNADVLESKSKGAMPFVVAEIQDESKVKAAGKAYSGPLEVVGSNTIISRLFAQIIRHRGMSTVYNALLSQSVSNNIYTSEFTEATGKAIYQLKPVFSKAILIGVVRPNEDGLSPMLNVPLDFKVKAGDRLVLIARNSDDLHPQWNEVNKIKGPQLVQRQMHVDEQVGVVKILILGWNHHILSLIKELCTYEDEFYEVTMVALYPKEIREREVEKMELLNERVTCLHIEADYVKESELMELNPEQFDAIILVSSDRILEKEEADARTIVGYVLLEEILETAEKRPHILLELADAKNHALLRQYDSEVIISPLIMSNLLAGVALQRDTNSIYKELFTVGGAEIIFRSPTEYEVEPRTMSFHDLEQIASEAGETLLGIYEGEDSEDKGRLFLNPGRYSRVSVKLDTRFVVLTTVY